MTTKLNRIIHGDCIKELARLDAGSIDLAFADPPFNIGYDYDEYHDKRSCDDYLAWSGEWMTGVKRALKPDGTFWLAIGDDYAAELKVLATRELGFVCRSWVIWYYTFGVHCTHKFTRSHTHLLYFVKDAKRFTFNSDDIRVPSARQLVYGDKRANPKGRVPDDTWLIPPEVGRDGGTKGRRDEEPSRDRKGAGNGRDQGSKGSRHRGRKSERAGVNGSFILRPQDLPDGFEADSDTWYFPRVCGTFKERTGYHGCQMPEQLLARIVRACSNEGDTVLDPFSGSGSTLMVAKKLARNYLGIELSKQYVTETRARLRKTKTGAPLDGFENPLTTVPDTKNGTIRTATGKRLRAQAAS